MSTAIAQLFKLAAFSLLLGLFSVHATANNLQFHSTSYEWLVIAGTQAKFKGLGTINGTGEYGFMLSATDSDEADRFRIKIWDPDDGDHVVYDNEPFEEDDAPPSTVIGGGSIVIHQGKKNAKTDEAGSDIPEHFELYGNYPNPFNPTTSISFGLPETSHITLTVYDILGRQVATLIDGETEAGRHTVTFDSDGLASGLYIYRLDTPEERFLNTMMLLR